MSAVGGVLWLKARAAEQIAEATIALYELEQGRAALLHDEPGAAIHLAKAYRRDPTPTTAFMLARTLQPRLAEQARLTSSFGRMWSATLSPDGKQVVTTDDKNAQIWDAESAHLLFTLPHGDTVYQAAFISGTRLVTTGSDGAVRIWEAASGRLVRELRGGRAFRYRLVGVSPDGKLVAAIDTEGTVAHVWNLDSGSLVAELRNDESGFPSIAFDGSGRWLATSGGREGRVFDARTWAQVRAIPDARRLSWSPDGRSLLTGSQSGDVSLWAIPSGARSHHLRDIGEPIDAVGFSPDGQRVVAASHDGVTQVWNVATGKLQSQGNHLHNPVRSIEFDPSSELIVAASTSGAIAVADAASGMLVSLLEGSRSVAVAARFDPTSRRVISAYSDGTARIWDASSPYRRWSSPPVAEGCGDIEPEQRFIAVSCDSQPTRIWDTARDKLVAELPSVTPVDGDFASALPVVSVTGDRAAIARGNTVEVYTLPDGQLLRTVVHGAAVNAVAFANAGTDLVSGAIDGSLLVTRDSGAQLSLPRSSAGIDVVGFLPDGRLVAADAQQRLRVYDVRGAVLGDLAMSARASTLRMSLDGRRLLSLPRFVGKVAPPQLWDVERYGAIGQLDDPGQGRVFAARFVSGGGSSQLVAMAWPDFGREQPGTSGSRSREARVFLRTRCCRLMAPWS